jgi:hypothetical protein
MKRSFLAATAASFIAMAAPAFGQQPATKIAAAQVTINACGAQHQVEIKAAPQGVDPRLAAYLGVYTGGQWSNNGGCNAAIIREVRSDGTATVRYIFPPYPDYPQGYFEKTDAKLEKDGRLFFYSGKGSKIWYTMQTDGQGLGGDFQPKDGSTALKLSGLRRQPVQSASR